MRPDWLSHVKADLSEEAGVASDRTGRRYTSVHWLIGWEAGKHKPQRRPVSWFHPTPFTLLHFWTARRLSDKHSSFHRNYIIVSPLCFMQVNELPQIIMRNRQRMRLWKFKNTSGMINKFRMSEPRIAKKECMSRAQLNHSVPKLNLTATRDIHMGIY